MFTRSVAVEIARPLDEVFVFVSDARNRPSWDDSVDSEELTSRTSVRFSVTGRPSRPLRLMQPLIARNTQRNLDAAFARLKAVLEDRP